MRGNLASLERNWNWCKDEFYKKSIFRKIRDLFDPTVPPSIKSKPKFNLIDGGISKRESNKYVISSIPTEQTVATNLIVSSQPPYENAAPVKMIPLIPIFIKKDISIPLPKFVPRFIDVSIPQLRVVRTIVKVKLPTIKINMTTLKKMGWIMLIVTCALTVTIASFLFYRGLQLMDGDFIGRTYQMKMAQFEKELVVPLEAKMQQLESKQMEIDAKTDAIIFRELTNSKIQMPKMYIRPGTGN